MKSERLPLRCRRESSVQCPFSRCIASSIEDCNFRSGRFSVRESRVGSVNFAVLSGSKFEKLRRVSPF